MSYEHLLFAVSDGPPGYGGTQRLPRRVGQGRALELSLDAGQLLEANRHAGRDAAFLERREAEFTGT